AKAPEELWPTGERRVPRRGARRTWRRTRVFTDARATPLLLWKGRVVSYRRWAVFRGTPCRALARDRRGPRARGTLLPRKAFRLPLVFGGPRAPGAVPCGSRKPPHRLSPVRSVGDSERSPRPTRGAPRACPGRRGLELSRRRAVDEARGPIGVFCGRPG